MLRKILVLVAAISIVVGMFSGCTSYQSGNKHDDWDWDFYNEH